ncbi:plasma membrane H+-transporting ATPase [Rhizoctonia solani]|uniref:Plasma membrane H+-transporting ATPase n=1 Tax=Rhizoctonia solani TaxID=456999 RepID=A0A0K6G7B4_9AGAM|nr:plasma membrane H+-transporting ATPase [Rhizoctonia solani]
MAQIELKAEDMYDKDKVDLETVLDDVFALLQCAQEGLTEFLGFMWNPPSWVMEGAALVAITLSNGGGRAPDWLDFVRIILLLINLAIGFYKERNSGNTVEALVDSLAPKAKVRCDGKWSEIESADLVLGDMIAFKFGDAVTANCRLTEAINVSIDQAALTGESLPQSKKSGDQCFPGSTCKQAHLYWWQHSSVKMMMPPRPVTCKRSWPRLVASAWVHRLVRPSRDSHLYSRFHYSYRRGLDNILVLLIGRIHIAMPTVLSVTLAVDAQQLAKHKAIVTRITAIKELTCVAILCSDKTRALTTNKLTIDKELVKCYGPFSPQDVILLAAYASRTENQDAIDQCVVGTRDDPTRARAGIKLLDFKPFNPVDKRAEITYREGSSGKLKRLEADVTEFAGRGLRALTVAYEELDHDNFEDEGNGFELIGLLAIFDPPREDTKQTIDDAVALGVRVKVETGRRFGLVGHMHPAKALKGGPPGGKHMSLDEMIMDADGLAGVFREHKYEIVKRLQGLGHLCAMTGDGANDAPALSRANISIGVESATDAARGAADILLTEAGLSMLFAVLARSSSALELERDTNCRKDHNDRQLHMGVYLRVAMISQALIFIIRSHGFFFMECPSIVLLGAFSVAQLVSPIAAYAD